MSDAYVPKQSVLDREYRKFKEDQNGDVAVNIVSANVEDQLDQVIHGLNSTGVNGPITVSTTAVEAKVGGARLAGRKLLTILNNGSLDIYYGYSAGVTVANGTPIAKNQLATFNIGDALGVYLVAASGSHNVRITEAF